MSDTSSPADAEQESGAPTQFDLGWHARDAEVERLRQQNAALRDALEKTAQALEWGQTRLPNSGHMMFGQPLIAARAALAQAAPEVEP